METRTGCHAGWLRFLGQSNYADFFRSNSDDDDDPNGEVINLGSPNSPDGQEEPPEKSSDLHISKTPLNWRRSSWQCGKPGPPKSKLVFMVFSCGYETVGCQWKPDFNEMCHVGKWSLEKRLPPLNKDAKGIDMFVDVSKFHNPERDKRLAWHIGENIHILEDFVDSTNFKAGLLVNYGC